MAINTKTIEDAIIARLQADSVAKNLQVEGFPDNPSTYSLIHPLGAALVSYTSSKYSLPDNPQYIQQVVDLEFSVSLIVMNLRDANGAYVYIDAIIASLAGYQPTGCTKMFPIAVDYQNNLNGKWEFSLSFQTSSEVFVP